MMLGTQKFDVAVIGAGMAGLICAQQLQRAGYSVVMLEKSRGVGGRMATRRVSDTRASWVTLPRRHRKIFSTINKLSGKHRQRL